MFRFSRALRLSLRLFQTRSFSSELLLDKLKNCGNEYQVFQLVGMHKPLLNSNHVGCAINLLWKFQNRRNVRLSLDEVCSHPEFIALQTLAENNFNYMDDNMLVDVLYAVLRLGVEAHNSLVLQLVLESWKRLETFDLSSLSKFSVCLIKQGLESSPLMGQIVSILDKNLENLHDLRILSIFMVRLLPVCSLRLQNRLIAKMESLMKDVEQMDLHTVQRILQFLHYTECSKLSLWEKCIQVVLQNITQVDLSTLCTIYDLCHSQRFKHSEFEVAAKSRLPELLNQCDNPWDFSKIFCTLLPWASQETRKRLEDDLLILADKIPHANLVFILIAMDAAKSRNRTLIYKIYAMILKHLDHYNPLQQYKITEALMSLPYQNHELYSSLQLCLIRNLKKSFITTHVILMTKALSMMHLTHVDDAIMSKLDAIIPQCNLSQIRQIAGYVMKWSMQKNRSGLYDNFFQKVNHEILLKIRNTGNIEDLEEIRYMVNKAWFEPALVEDILSTCQRLLHQVTWKNVALLSTLITYIHIRCTPILDKIAEEATGNIPEFSLLDLYNILRPFCFLNYNPPNREEFFNLCIQRCLANLNLFSPHHLLMLGYSLALAEYFPEDLVKTIFNIDFLRRLDSELEGLTQKFTVKIRHRLMKLNQAVCIERPEYQIPWFHDQYCQVMQQTVREHTRAIYHHTWQLLGEALGGVHFTRMSVATPYGHPIDFEFLLDKNKNPVSYNDQNMCSDDLSEDVHMVQHKTPLPPGTQRFALEFISPSAFCRNSPYLNGDMAMKIRHLELLGYSVIQIPSLEWKSMEREPDQVRINFLKQKIFGEL